MSAPITLDNLKHIADFWEEVVSTIDFVLAEMDESSLNQMMKRYHERLRQIDKNLTFHFEQASEERRLEMVFGCDGYTQSISSVLNLVSAAPRIDGVEVVAFNHRHNPLPSSVRVDDEEFTVEDFWFDSRLAHGAYHLSLFVPGYESLDDPPVVEAAMVYIDAILGEFDLMTRVSTLSWYELPDNPEDHGLTPLSYLRDDFDDVRGFIDLIGVTLH